MQLGRSLLGALIGAALGIGLLIAVYLMFQIDRAWLAVLVALLVGFSVRMLVSTTGHASYARGALTGLIALLAYVGGWFLVAQVAQTRAAQQVKVPTQVAAPGQPADDEASGEAAEAAPPPVAEAPPMREGAPMAGNPQRGREFDTMDFIWLSIAALVAYELGRGSGAAPRVDTDEDGTPIGDGEPSLRHGAEPVGTSPGAVPPPD